MNGCVKFRHLSFALGVASLTFSLACGAFNQAVAVAAAVEVAAVETRAVCRIPFVIGNLKCS